MKITRNRLRRLIKGEIDKRLVREHIEGWVDSHREGGKFSGVNRKDYEKSWDQMSYLDQGKVGISIVGNIERYFKEESQNHGVSKANADKVWNNKDFKKLLKKIGARSVWKLIRKPEIMSGIEDITNNPELRQQNATDELISDTVAKISKFLEDEGVISREAVDYTSDVATYTSSTTTRVKGAPAKKPQIAGSHRNIHGDLKY